MSEALCVLNKNRTMDDIQKHNNSIDLSPSQIFRSYSMALVRGTSKVTDRVHGRWLLRPKDKD